MSNGRKWEGTTAGSGWMHRSLIFLLRHVDVRVIYAIAYVFVVPFYLLFGHSYGFIYKYFRKGFGHSPLKACLEACANHFIFSQMVIDKFAMYAGKKFNVHVVGREYFETLAKKDESFIQLSSHIGNYEIAGYTLVSSNKPMNALVYADEKESVMENRSRMFGETNIRMLLIEADMSHLFTINMALDNGEIVSMPADRLVGSQKTVEVGFFGRRTAFPAGPASLATMRQLNVLAVNVMKTGTKQYTIFVKSLEYDRNASRNEQVRQLVEGYVAELERVLRMYPLQWFNYFDFLGE